MLPIFVYHPDPISTGSIQRSDATCRCCEQPRGYIYTGPVYAEEEFDEALCPWCIADGSAAQRFSAEFTDSAGVGGYGEWPDVPEAVIWEVSQRTPGFSGWQQERWWTCCNDAGQFLGPAGHDELTGRWPEAIPVIEMESGLDKHQWATYFGELNREYGPTAYVFRCRHCGQLGGYSDFP